MRNMKGFSTENKKEDADLGQSSIYGRQTDRQRQRDRQRHRHRETETERDREKEREREREREKERKREKERERERGDKKLEICMRKVCPIFLCPYLSSAVTRELFAYLNSDLVKAFSLSMILILPNRATCGQTQRHFYPVNSLPRHLPARQVPPPHGGSCTT